MQKRTADRLEEQILSLDTMLGVIENMKRTVEKSRGLLCSTSRQLCGTFIFQIAIKGCNNTLRVMYAGRDMDNQLNLHTKAIDHQLILHGS